MLPRRHTKLPVRDVEQIAPLNVTDFREMRNEMVAEGMFKASVPYYTFNILSPVFLAWAAEP